MARRRHRRRHFRGTKIEHRSDAAHNAKEARRFAQTARSAARHGDCRNALHYFGLSAFYAGIAIGNRKWAVYGRGARGGSHLGGHIYALQRTVFRACRVER